MKIHTFGTSAGTQPIDGFHHTSLAIETDNSLYFLDAGECCAYTAHLMGIDLLKTKAVFISHPHMDHVGGLGNLLWYIRKVGIVRKSSLINNDNIDIFTPVEDTVNGFLTVLRNTEGDFKTEYTHTVRKYSAGQIYKNDEITVEAVPTHHMPDGKSFAFRINCENKTVVFSGDMRLEDIPDILPEKCDVFMVETGHHQIEDICAGIKATGKTVKNLFFVHHGGYIMRDTEAAKTRAENAFGKNTVICLDKHSYDI